MLRIITTHKLRFYNKDRSENFVSSGKNIIENAPEWIKYDDMYTAARSCGRLQIISSRSDEKELENNPQNHLAQNSHEAKEFMGEEKGQSDSDEKEEEVIEEEAGEDSDEENDQDNEETPEERKKRLKAERRAARKANK